MLCGVMTDAACIFVTEVKMEKSFPKIIIITGHYGSGKTNVSVNIALDLAKRGEKVTVIDLDIVNPYFRTADFEGLFKDNNIALRTPLYANSNLDIPALNFDISSVINQEGYVIIDVGGDDAGATALGRYANVLSGRDDASVFYVVNRFRYLTREPEEALSLMKDIEFASQLRCKGIINNSNLGELTDKNTVDTGEKYAKEIAAAAGLPLVMTCAEKKFLEGIESPYEIDIFVKPVWEKENI